MKDSHGLETSWLEENIFTAEINPQLLLSPWVLNTHQEENLRYLFES